MPCMSLFNAFTANSGKNLATEWEWGETNTYVPSEVVDDMLGLMRYIVSCEDVTVDNFMKLLVQTREVSYDRPDQHANQIVLLDITYHAMLQTIKKRGVVRSDNMRRLFDIADPMILFQDYCDEYYFFISKIISLYNEKVPPMFDEPRQHNDDFTTPPRIPVINRQEIINAVNDAVNDETTVINLAEDDDCNSDTETIPVVNNSDCCYVCRGRIEEDDENVISLNPELQRNEVAHLACLNEGVHNLIWPRLYNQLDDLVRPGAQFRIRVWPADDHPQLSSYMVASGYRPIREEIVDASSFNYGRYLLSLNEHEEISYIHVRNLPRDENDDNEVWTMIILPEQFSCDVCETTYIPERYTWCDGTAFMAAEMDGWHRCSNNITSRFYNVWRCSHCHANNAQENGNSQEIAFESEEETEEEEGEFICAACEENANFECDQDALDAEWTCDLRGDGSWLCDECSSEERTDQQHFFGEYICGECGLNRNSEFQSFQDAIDDEWNRGLRRDDEWLCACCSGDEVARQEINEQLRREQEDEREQQNIREENRRNNRIETCYACNVETFRCNLLESDNNYYCVACIHEINQ